jgi:multidrug efflux pump subunit AcrA (membrane-fusion protein)
MQGDVRFKAGESFRKGDVIINIYSEDVQAALKSGKSSFLQTVSKILQDLKVDYKNQYNKWITFFNDINPEKPLPELPEIKSDKERVFLASNNVLTSYYNLKQQQIKLDRYIIRAPFTGSFKSVNKEIGAVASPGAELATIIRSDKFEVIVPVFPKDLKWLKKGDNVNIIDNRGVEQITTVSRISSFVDEATQSVNVYLTFNAKPNNKILDGEYVDVKVIDCTAATLIGE